MTTTAPASDRGTPRPHRPRWLMLIAVLVAVLVVLGIGAAITAVVVTRDDTQSNPSSAARLSTVQASCGDWTSSLADSQPDDQWCTDMFAWMGAQSGGSMMGSMIWQGPTQLGRACRAWVSQDQADAGATGEQRCADMVTWMNVHMSSRGGRWMMQGR